MIKFSSACSDFGLTVSLKKTKVLSQGKYILLTIKLDDMYIENVNNFVYIGSSIASNASMYTEISCRISKASGTFSQLSATV